MDKKTRHKRVQTFLKGEINEEKCLQISNDITEFDNPSDDFLDRYDKLDFIETVVMFLTENNKLRNELQSLRMDILRFAMEKVVEVKKEENG